MQKKLRVLSGANHPYYQSINQSTLFKHGKWLSKLVFRHAVQELQSINAKKLQEFQDINVKTTNELDIT